MQYVLICEEKDCFVSFLMIRKTLVFSLKMIHSLSGTFGKGFLSSDQDFVGKQQCVCFYTVMMIQSKTPLVFLV